MFELVPLNTGYKAHKARGTFRETLPENEHPGLANQFQLSILCMCKMH